MEVHKLLKATYITEHILCVPIYIQLYINTWCMLQSWNSCEVKVTFDRLSQDG